MDIRSVSQPTPIETPFSAELAGDIMFHKMLEDEWGWKVGGYIKEMIIDFNRALAFNKRIHTDYNSYKGHFYNWGKGRKYMTTDEALAQIEDYEAKNKQVDNCYVMEDFEDDGEPEEGSPSVSH